MTQQTDKESLNIFKIYLKPIEEQTLTGKGRELLQKLLIKNLF